MFPKQAYDRIRRAINNDFERNDKWSRRIFKKYKYKYKNFRVPEYEMFLSKNSYYSYKYATEIIKRKLPENMHNKMMGWFLANDQFAKKYFYYIKQIQK
jgi:hypothetical protein